MLTRLRGVRGLYEYARPRIRFCMYCNVVETITVELLRLIPLLDVLLHLEDQGIDYDWRLSWRRNIVSPQLNINRSAAGAPTA